MPITVETSSDKRTIVATYIHPVDFIGDVNVALKGILEHIESVTQFPAFVIIDVSKLDLTFADIVLALGEIGGSDIGKQLMQSYQFETIYVGTHELAKLTAEALKQPQYGAYGEIPVFASMEEAQEYITSKK